MSGKNEDVPPHLFAAASDGEASCKHNAKACFHCYLEFFCFLLQQVQQARYYLSVTVLGCCRSVAVVTLLT